MKHSKKLFKNFLLFSEIKPLTKIEKSTIKGGSDDTIIEIIIEEDSIIIDDTDIF